MNDRQFREANRIAWMHNFAEDAKANKAKNARELIAAHNAAVRRARWVAILDAALTLALAAVAVWIIYTHAN